MQISSRLGNQQLRTELMEFFMYAIRIEGQREERKAKGRKKSKTIASKGSLNSASDEIQLLQAATGYDIMCLITWY